MHLYASGDAYKKGLEKARKPLYIKEKTEFLSLVCIVCINIRGFLPFSRILYKGMMHTMHTRARTIPGTLEPSRNGRKRCMHPRMHTDAYRPAGMHTGPMPATDGHRFAVRVPPASAEGRTSSDPPIRFAGPRGVRDAVEPHARILRHCEVLPSVLYACMHLYASGDAYKKGLEKARKPLYIQGKDKIPFSCMHCMHQYKGFLPFSRILYKGMMHTMHTRAEAAPERWNQAETEEKNVCIRGCIRMHTREPECIHGPMPAPTVSP